MIGILDISYLLNNSTNNKNYLLNFTKLYTTNSAISEFKSEEAQNLLSFLNVPLETIFVSPGFVKIFEALNLKNNLNLSKVDIELCALTLQLVEDNSFYTNKDNLNTQKNFQIKCLTNDNGIKQALKLLNLSFSGENFFEDKIFVFRCFCCFKIYKEVEKINQIFCKNCGQKTVTRVSLKKNGENNKYSVNIKKGYKFRPKAVKDRNGNVITGADDRKLISMKKEFDN